VDFEGSVTKAGNEDVLQVYTLVQSNDKLKIQKWDLTDSGWNAAHVTFAKF
jgi:hypothetical protein